MAVTPNVGLELFEPLGVGWREDATAGALLDFNMMLLDSTIESLIVGGGSSVYVNAAKITSPNFNDSAPAAPGGYGNVVWQVTGSSVSAYVPLQVNADWNASSGLAQILNRPATIVTRVNGQVGDVNLIIPGGTWNGLAGYLESLIPWGTVVLSNTQTESFNEVALSGNWVQIEGSYAIDATTVPKSLKTASVVSNRAAMYFNNGSWTQNQSSSVTTQAVCTDEDYDSIGPAVEVSLIGGVVSYYCWYVTHTSGTAYLFKQVGNSIIIFATTSYLALPGDVNTLTYNNGVLNAYINGVLVLSATDSTPLPAGSPGIAGFAFYDGPTDYPDNRASSWSGSNLTVSIDTAISRLSAGTLAIGNGAASNTSGQLSLAVVRNTGFTVAALPSTSATGMVEGAVAYATNGLKVGETTGNGTGVPVYYSNGHWRVYSTDLTVAA